MHYNYLLETLAGQVVCETSFDKPAKNNSDWRPGCHLLVCSRGLRFPFDAYLDLWFTLPPQ